jgi:UDP-glucose 4-epimerase
MTKVLVSGGCGYIGSHTIVDLINNGFDVISADNFSNSDKKVLDGIEEITGKRVKNYNVDLTNLEGTRKIFEENNDITGIIHFAALKSVGESVSKPLEYFQNNLNSLLNLLQCVKEFEVPNFIFSSSCSVYGNAEDLPVTETTPWAEAESPYARTKQMGENILKDFSYANPNSKFVILRYFNPGGAHESAIIGEAPIVVASNLVPVITETAIGLRNEMLVFGDDYDTRDGSCIRDYIHVMDLANAHTKSLQYALSADMASNYEIFNLGIGEGVTVLEAIRAFEKVTDKQLNYKITDRREGDVVAIYANNQNAFQKLGWNPNRNIEDIMKTAWAWQLRRSAVPS